MKILGEIKSNKGIYIICFIYFLLSIIFLSVFHEHNLLGNEQRRYISSAYSIIEDGRFYFANEPDTFRTPGYPLMLALIYILGGNNITVAVVQIVLSTMGIYLIYSTLLLLSTPKNLALLGTSLLIFNLSAYICSTTILNDTPFGFLLVLSLYLFTKWRASGYQALPYFIGFAISLNYALFMRPILMYYNILVVIALFISLLLKKIHWKYFALFFICFAVIFFGWSFRNYLHSSVFTYSTVRDNNLLTFDAAYVAMEVEGFSSDREGRHYLRAIFEEEYSHILDSNLSDAQRDKLYGEFGSRYIREHFWVYLRINIVGLYYILFESGAAFFSSVYPNIKGTITATLLWMPFKAYLYAVYALYLLGLWFNRKKLDIIQISILLLCGYLAVAGASNGAADRERFRDPFFPLLVLSAVSNCPILIERISVFIDKPIITKIKKWLLKVGC